MLPVLCWISLTGIFLHLTRIKVSKFGKLTDICVILSEFYIVQCTGVLWYMIGMTIEIL